MLKKGGVLLRGQHFFIRGGLSTHKWKVENCVKFKGKSLQAQFLSVQYRKVLFSNWYKLSSWFTSDKKIFCKLEILQCLYAVLVQWWGKKKWNFDPHLIFPNNLRRHEIFYDKVKIGVRFHHKNYGAHICRWGLPLAYVAKFWTFKMCPNPGGDLEIWDIFLREVWTLMDNEKPKTIL